MADKNLKHDDENKNKESEENVNIIGRINRVVVKPIVEIHATVEGLETSMV